MQHGCTLVLVGQKSTVLVTLVPWPGPEVAGQSLVHTHCQIFAGPSIVQVYSSDSCVSMFLEVAMAICFDVVDVTVKESITQSPSTQALKPCER